MLKTREFEYQYFQDFYQHDGNIRLAYSTAVSIVCDEKQASLNSSSET